MKVLVVGAGGREHAIVRALRRSPQVPEIIATPGNPGIAQDARLAGVGVMDIDGLVALARDEAVDLVVPGPEAPLVAGLADALDAAGIAVAGPISAAARLEGSKAFAKEVMRAAGVPTADFAVVDSVDSGLEAIGGSYPAVVKFDGLAAGKGVVIADDEDAARDALHEFLVQRKHGAGDVVIEQHLTGEELSLLALCDGERAVPLAPAQDYKRIFDGDEGPNTGGMGSYSPVGGVDDHAAISALVHQPIVDELKRRGTPFRGILYAGLMLTDEGPKVIEYNVRFGDPETQAVLPRLTSDLLDLLMRTATPGGLAGAELAFDDGWAVTLVLASGGYPETSSHGDVISGIEAVAGDVEVTHAGTARNADGALVTAGGRVLNVTGLGPDPAAARDAAYAAADQITFDGRQLRRDIAQRAVERHASPRS